jgi:predicted HicB family RNase H-like nuclease
MAVQKRVKSNQTAQAEKDAQAFIGGGDAKPAPVAAKAAKKPVALRFDSDLLARIDAAAAARGISRNAWISWQCAEGLKNE